MVRSEKVEYGRTVAFGAEMRFSTSFAFDVVSVLVFGGISIEDVIMEWFGSEFKRRIFVESKNWRWPIGFGVFALLWTCSDLTVGSWLEFDLIECSW